MAKYLFRSSLTVEGIQGLLKEGGTARRKAVAQAAEAFLWELAVHTSRGRIPEGVLLDEPLYLRHWPNLTRLKPIPGAPRIAAVWVQEPRSLLNMAGAVKVPMTDLLTFYSAANAIGLAGVGKREVDNLIVPPPCPSDPVRRGLENDRA